MKSLTIEVKAENYKAILSLLKKALVENSCGYDAKDERMGNDPNQMNIKSMLNDLDLDANNTEVEFQAGFEELLWFCTSYFANSNMGDFTKENVNIIFNRDGIINESEIIKDCVMANGLISSRTIIANFPWVTDVDAEIAQMQKEQGAYDYDENIPQK